MMNTSTSAAADDALLTGLSRLPPPSHVDGHEGPEPSISHSVLPLELPHRALQRSPPQLSAQSQGVPSSRQRRTASMSQVPSVPRGDPLERVPLSFYRSPAQQPAPPVPRVDPLDPVARVDVHEMVERATDLVGKSGSGDRTAAERLLQWMRAGSVSPVDVFRKVVAGTDSSRPEFNARVLSVVHWLCVTGGPFVLTGALHATHPRRPCAVLRIILDVLRALGYDDAEDALHDDSRVRAMHIRSKSSGSDSRSSSRIRGSRSATALAVESYAIALGRKFIFHQRFPDVEVNYSLDRFYRTLHVENGADDLRRETNDERHAVIVSHAALADVALIALAFTSAVQRLEQAKVAPDIIILALGEATNALVFAEYLSMKTASSDLSDYDLSQEKRYLRQKLREVVELGGNDLRMLKRFVDSNVYRSITEPDSRPFRPESRHRREIQCHFTSFQSLHKAVTPPMLLNRPRPRK